MRLFLTLFLIINIKTCFAQINKQSAFIVNINYHIPSEFFAELFENNPSIGTSFFIEKENNIFYGIEANYLFGNNIKNESLILSEIKNHDGSIIASDGYFANINFSRRGFSSNIFTGYALHFNKTNLSGIYFSLGGGYINQKILIDTKNENIPQLNEEYKKGYDSANDGIFGKLSINYKYYRKKGGIQISAGFYNSVARVKRLNTYIFNENINDDSFHIGSEFGFNLGLIIPVSKINQEEFHYY
tara:strand:+ start:516 stop:1247 length:732 start_codon:yes stop_codon:yes gene_type:complete